MKKVTGSLLFAIMVFALLAQPKANAVSNSDAEAAQVAVGVHHSVVLMSDGRLYTFGNNASGSLGIGLGSNYASPVPCEVGDGYTAIAAGRSHNLALKDDVLYAWGSNSTGQLGNGSNIDSNKPIRIGSGFTVISARDGSSFGLKGEVLYAWGDNLFSQLGIGTDVSQVKTPQKVGSGFTAVSSGYYHTLALKKDVLYAWGSNWNGQMGSGTGGNYNIPVKIGTGYSAIAAGYQYSTALKANDLYMWGSKVIKNGANDTYTIEKSNTPKFIGSGYTAISAGDSYMLAIKNGELFLYDMTKASGIVQRLGKGFIAISTDYSAFALAIKDDGVYSWGDDNWRGEQGNGTFDANPIPTRISFTVSSQTNQTSRPTSTSRSTVTPTPIVTATPIVTPTPTTTPTPEPTTEWRRGPNGEYIYTY